MSPKVSVLMAVYKTDLLYLEQAICSISNQTFKDFEFLIVDDFSQDENLSRMLQSYAKADKRIKIYTNERNLGISGTRNKLLSLAKGEYLAVVDHDDISLPERLSRQVEFLDNHPKIGVLGTWYENIPNKIIQKNYILNHQIEKDLMFHCSVLHPSSMLRKSVLDKHNICYEDEFSPAEDYALWCRLIGKTQFANLPEVLFQYRDYKFNTSKVQALKMSEATKKIYEFVHRDCSEIYARACSVQNIKIFGIPFLTKKTKGCRNIYKLFGKTNLKIEHEIDMFDCSKLPIYIISFNRVEHLKTLISFLEKQELFNIHIIDNASTYPPLLEYLKETPYTVHHMSQNYGHMVFFKADEFKDVRENQYYVLTDPDVVPIEECPADFLSYFYKLLQNYPKFNKVGFSLKLDDIPDENETKSLIVRWETLFYLKKLNWFKPVLYASFLDTTFALYRPKKEWKHKSFYKAIRTEYPYQARHLPWYKDLSKLNAEDVFYNQLDCGSGNWNSKDTLQTMEETLRNKKELSWHDRVFSIKKTASRKIVRFLGLKISFKS